MIKFALGIAILFLTVVVGIYKYHDVGSQIDSLAGQVEEAIDKRDMGKDLQKRITVIRKMSLENEDASQKFNMERMLDIGAPRLEWKFIGPALVRGNNRALFRYTFRVTGVATYDDVQGLVERMVGMPGFVPYRLCFACSQAPRGTPQGLSSVQLEGYVYAFDPATFY